MVAHQFMSASVYSQYTKRIKSRPKQKRGEVPMPQLYKEISAGYEHFLAKKMMRETLQKKRRQ